jgi:hypothetical protein
MTDEEIIRGIARYVSVNTEAWEQAEKLPDWREAAKIKKPIEKAIMDVFRAGIQEWLRAHGMEAHVYCDNVGLYSYPLYHSPRDERGAWRGYELRGRETYFRMLAVGIWNSKGSVNGKPWMNKLIVRGPNKKDIRQRATTDPDYLVGGKAWGFAEFVWKLEAEINKGKEAAWKHE